MVLCCFTFSAHLTQKNITREFFIWALFQLSRFKYFRLRLLLIDGLASDFLDLSLLLICLFLAYLHLRQFSAITIVLCQFCHQHPFVIFWANIFWLLVSRSTMSVLCDPKSMRFVHINFFKWRLRKAPTRPSFNVQFLMQSFQECHLRMMHPWDQDHKKPSAKEVVKKSPSITYWSATWFKKHWIWSTCWSSAHLWMGQNLSHDLIQAQYKWAVFTACEQGVQYHQKMGLIPTYNNAKKVLKLKLWVEGCSGWTCWKHPKEGQCREKDQPCWRLR